MGSRLPHCFECVLLELRFGGIPPFLPSGPHAGIRDLKEYRELSQASVSMVYHVDGKEVVVDEDGFLVNPESWSKELAEILAKEDGLTDLSQGHWRIISFLREYYFVNGRAPLNAELKKGTGLSMAEIQACFPGGIRKGARRLAGLPNLKGCE